MHTHRYTHTHIYICTHIHVYTRTHPHTHAKHTYALIPGPYATLESKISPNSYFNSQTAEAELPYNPSKSRERGAGLS